MAGLAAIRPYVTPYAGSAPGPVVDQAIRSAARRFFFASGCWRATLSTVTVVDQADYGLVALLPAGVDAELVRVLKVKWAGSDVAQRAWRVALPGTLTLSPAPTIADETLEVLAVLQPTPAWAAIDDTLAGRWAEGIAAGALQELYARPQWRDPDGFAEQRATFAGAIRDARGETYRQYTGTPLEARPRKLLG